MSFPSVIAVTLVLGLIAVLGIAMVSYMSALVQSAYEIRVTMRDDLDDGLKNLEDEITRQNKWTRGDIHAEAEKARTRMMDDLKQRQEANHNTLAASLEAKAASWADEHQALKDEIVRLSERLTAWEEKGVHRSGTRPLPSPAVPDKGTVSA